jgi:hypothetical protein
MFNTVARKRIALLGAAFKANTGDTRDSPALAVTRALLEEHADLVLSDPHALENAAIDLGAEAKQVEFEQDPYVAAQGAHAIALLTEWKHGNSISTWITRKFTRAWSNRPSFSTVAMCSTMKRFIKSASTYTPSANPRWCTSIATGVEDVRLTAAVVHYVLIHQWLFAAIVP